MERKEYFILFQSLNMSFIFSDNERIIRFSSLEEARRNCRDNSFIEQSSCLIVETSSILSDIELDRYFNILDGALLMSKIGTHKEVVGRRVVLEILSIYKIHSTEYID